MFKKQRKLSETNSYPKSEVNDEFANDIDKSCFIIFLWLQITPKIGSYLENYNSSHCNQHLTHAHPENNTHMVSRDYQFDLLDL